MVRTQIQLPDPLYREVQRVAKTQDWSLAEVMRRGAEAVVRAYPAIKVQPGQAWQFPAPIASKVLVDDAAAMREIVMSDAEPEMP